MGQRKLWLGTEVMKHKYYHSEDPKYGQPFQIMAIQFESIEKEFSSWIENGKIQFGDGIFVSFSDYLNKIRQVGEDWKKMKDKISDDICKDLNRILDMCENLNNKTRVKDVVAYKIHYVGEPKDKVQIL